MTTNVTTDVKIQAYQWWCGDDVCDCTQYVIERVTPHAVTRGFVNRERLWEGPFVSESSALTRGEKAELLREFRSAARRHGIRLSRDNRLYPWRGERSA